MKLLWTLSSSFFAIILAVAPAPAKERGQRSDNIPGRLSLKQNIDKQKALQSVLKGQAKAFGKNKVIKVAGGQYVELAFEGEDQILTLLAEFGTQPAGHQHGTQFIFHSGLPGPLHNSIPEPNRDTDNLTIWKSDFNSQYYKDLLYSKTIVPSMATYYLEASSGRYSVDGYVSDWVQVPFNAAAYGSDYCGEIICTRDIGLFLVDQGNAWYNKMLETMSPQEIETFLGRFDVWDRYDYDGDGNFNEPDGYIDHFQSVHAGVGEETGGGAYGSDAIWSHRSYVDYVPIGTGGPVINGNLVPFGGMRLGNSSKWVGDYTIEPENGGVGVFAHEFAHDLGLPDEYDTSNNTGGSENATGFWTIMSDGAYGSFNTFDAGTAPVHFNAWDKLMLGWLNYAVVEPGRRASVKLGPAETNTKQTQGIVALLPDKVKTTHIGDPYSGNYFYFSGAGNNLNSSMTRSITLGTAPVQLSLIGKWQIEACWDYAYLQVSTDNGSTWVNINTSASTTNNEHNQNEGYGITGTSGSATLCDAFYTPSWVSLTADLSPYANSTVQLRFAYKTDVSVAGAGFFFDDLSISGFATDGGETDIGWSYDGFFRTNGDVAIPYFNAYVAEFRQYLGYDRALLSQFNWSGIENIFDRLPYQDGLLISYWDSSFTDNNVGDHPGSGLLLPIDAHPAIEHWSDGRVLRPEVQSYDATFGLWPTDSVSLRRVDVGLTASVASKPGVPLFDDRNDYWFATDSGDPLGFYKARWASVKVPKTGTTIRVVGYSAQDNFLQVLLNSR